MIDLTVNYKNNKDQLNFFCWTEIYIFLIQKTKQQQY